MTDIIDNVDTVDQDAMDAQKLAEGLRQLRELRGYYDEATAELESARAAGRARVAELQAEIDAENAKLVEAANAAASRFNTAAGELVDTGFIAPRVLAGKGLATIRLRK